MDYQALSDELNNDPEGMGYSTHLPEDHNSCVSLLKRDDPTGATFYEPIPNEEATIIAAQNGALAALDGARGSGNASTKSRAYGAWQTLQKTGEDFAMQNPAVRQMLQDLVDDGILTSTQQTAFLDASERPARREEVVLQRDARVYAPDISKALS